MGDINRRKDAFFRALPESAKLNPLPPRPNSGNLKLKRVTVIGLKSSTWVQ